MPVCKHSLFDQLISNRHIGVLIVFCVNSSTSYMLSVTRHFAALLCALLVSANRRGKIHFRQLLSNEQLTIDVSRSHYAASLLQVNIKCNKKNFRSYSCSARIYAAVWLIAQSSLFHHHRLVAWKTFASMRTCWRLANVRVRRVRPFLKWNP